MTEAENTLPDENRAADTIRQNVRRMIEVEEAAMEHRHAGARLAQGIGTFAGTGPFVALQTAAVVAWVGLNLHLGGLRPFDPYPFNLLSTCLSLEAVLLTAFVLMKQRRQGRLADRRSHLDLQVNLMTEREVSLIIEMLERLAHRLDAPQAVMREATDLSRTSTTEQLVDELHRHLPESGLDLSTE